MSETLKKRLQLASNLRGAARLFDEAGAHLDAATMQAKGEAAVHLHSLDPAQDIMDSTMSAYPEPSEGKNLTPEQNRHYTRTWRREITAG